MVVYLVRGSRLPAYLSEIYKYQYTGNLSSIQNSSNLRFSSVDFFSSIWKNAYGSAFDRSNYQEDWAILNGDFNCLNPSLVKSGSGTISKIEKNKIYV